ncbi:MAG: isocitrate lyase/phosphoenolpyruvate mutase family protein [Planctomycetota bacterium]
MQSHSETPPFDLNRQREKAEILRALHKTPPLLTLPNAWDVASAKIFEIEGFKAIGTTSAGISATLGYPDGERMTIEENAAVVQRIARHVNLPLNADLEAGYSASMEGLARSVKIMLQAGAVGLNLEDSTGDQKNPLYELSIQAERLREVRKTAASEGIPAVLNARIDTYLTLTKPPQDLLRITIERAHAYLEAGADCVFIPTYLDQPGLLDQEAIVHLVTEIQGPVNLLAGAVTFSLAELEALGVARVSVGPGPMRATLALIRNMAKELLTKGTYTSFTNQTIPYSEVNQWFL